MSNTQIDQGVKVIIDGGGEAPSRIDQGLKVVLLTVGSVPSHIDQGLKVILMPAFEEIPSSPRRRGFMSFRP